MDRELLLILLTLAGVIAANAVGAAIAVALPMVQPADVSGPLRLAAATRALLLPLMPGLMMFAALVGWALVEPEDAESMPWPAWAATLPVLVIWSRAALRAWASLVTRPSVRTAATIGVLRPQIVVAPSFAVSLDQEALTAALAHERAHQVHRDPLRIWVAQLVTDFQWPFPGAVRRFESWLIALEIARDDEARRSVGGDDLAAALLGAARFSTGLGDTGASLTGDGQQLVLRIQRLLAPEVAHQPDRTAVGLGAALLSLVAACVVVGATWGEPVVQWLARR